MNLSAQARDLGILTEFFDGQGQRHVTDETALKIIVESFPARAPCRFVEGPVVIRSGRAARTQLGAAATLPLRWEIAGPKVIARGVSMEHVIVWPHDLPVGSYRLKLTDATSVHEEVPLLVAPARAFGGEFDRGWLLAVQLYGVRSA